MGGETKSLTLVGVNTLEGLAGLINDNFEGVSASVINTGAATNPYRLVVNGSEAGTANAFTLDLSGLSGGVVPTMTTLSTAGERHAHHRQHRCHRDQQQSDRCHQRADAQPARATPLQHITISVARDTDGISAKVKGLVDAYNDLYTYLDKQTGAEGSLRGNSAARTVDSRMTSLIGSSLDGGLGSITRLSEMGITRGEDGTLQFDDAEFKDVLAEQFGNVRDFFISREGNVGKAYMLDQAIKNMTSSTEGLFKISTDSLNKRIKYTDDSISRYERSIESYQTTMQRRFTAMEQMVSQLQAQGNQLSSIVYQS
jgi:flagellar hook-associated protein 2